MAPPLFTVAQDQRSGPRNNEAFEGLSFSPDGNSLWASLEGPLYQDGPLPDPTHGAVNRITHFSRDGKVLGQYAYPLDAIPARPGKGKAADNGISEMLALSDTRMLCCNTSMAEGVRRGRGRVHHALCSCKNILTIAENAIDCLFSNS